MDPDKKVPATIVSGFLGAGKTTIISHLIDRLIAQHVKVAYIKNEIGDTDVDASIMSGKHIKTWELIGGCICCTLTGPFYHAINELVDTVCPERIIIEASGVADPSAIALLISSHPKVSRDGVLSIIDVVNFEGYKDLSLTARRQAQFTDLIIFNKIELADLPKKKAVVSYVRELNTDSPIIEAPGGVVDPGLVFGLSTRDIHNLNGILGSDTHNKHLAQEHIDSFRIEPDKPFDKDKLTHTLCSLPVNIIRVKGIVRISSGWSIVNMVGKRTTIQDIALSKDPGTGHMVFIGIEVSGLRDDVTRQLCFAYHQ